MWIVLLSMLLPDGSRVRSTSSYFPQWQIIERSKWWCCVRPHINCVICLLMSGQNPCKMRIKYIGVLVPNPMRTWGEVRRTRFIFWFIILISLIKIFLILKLLDAPLSKRMASITCAVPLLIDGDTGSLLFDLSLQFIEIQMNIQEPQYCLRQLKMWVGTQEVAT